jgi:hypothetical protein
MGSTGAIGIIGKDGTGAIEIGAVADTGGVEENNCKISTAAEGADPKEDGATEGFAAEDEEENNALISRISGTGAEVGAFFSGLLASTSVSESMATLSGELAGSESVTSPSSSLNISMISDFFLFINSGSRAGRVRRSLDRRSENIGDINEENSQARVCSSRGTQDTYCFRNLSILSLEWTNRVESLSTAVRMYCFVNTGVEGLEAIFSNVVNTSSSETRANLTSEEIALASSTPDDEHSKPPNSPTAQTATLTRPVYTVNGRVSILST